MITALDRNTVTLQFPALESVAGEVQHEEAEQRQVDSHTQDHLAHLAQPDVVSEVESLLSFMILN